MNKLYYGILAALLFPPLIFSMKRVPNWTEEQFRIAREKTEAQRKQIMRDTIADLKKKCAIAKKMKDTK